MAAVIFGLAGCAPGPGSAAAPTSTPVGASTAQAPTRTPTPTAAPITFVSVVDGDTIETSAGTVRIIGIDAPELGECGHDEASAAFAAVLAPGDPVTLELPAGQNDVDKYARLLRYVTTSAGIDLGMLQLEAGNALAKYDSTDGYPAHPREAAYHAAQTASADADGSVVTVACQPAAVVAPPEPVAPAAPPAESTENKWWLQYSSCSKLKKNGVGDPTGPFSRDDPAQAEIYDWFENGTGNHGDGDSDGLACE